MKTILFFVMLVATGIQANSQCDKKVTWYATKGEMYNTNGALLDTKLDSIFLETDAKTISLRFKFDDKPLEGTITEKICDWKESFRNGKTVYHATVFVDGISSNAIFTVEAKDGKITLSLEIEVRKERKFLIYISKYEEMN
ncbi:MAG TPA: hypothetical protein VKB95_03925 [Chitinophagaceae bacterium]|nr:hypothetical protein [Chitinophagaceae bacterium]